MPRTGGHLAGVDAVRSVVGAAPGLGVEVLSLFAFSSDNWHRPADEVAALMMIFREYLLSDLDSFVARGIRTEIIGRRDRLPEPLRVAAQAVERATEGGGAMLLRIALDYSARDCVLRAVRQLAGSSDLSQQAFERCLAEVQHASEPCQGVDLLIRTGGEQRLSDCLLWEAAYAELHFTKRLWPDFTASDLASAVEEFHRRERRFGRISEDAAEVLEDPLLFGFQTCP